MICQDILGLYLDNPCCESYDYQSIVLIPPNLERRNSFMKKPLVLPFDSSDATLENVGGKGANLSFLTHAGFPVPQGFLLTTQA